MVLGVEKLSPAISVSSNVWYIKRNIINHT